MRPFLLSRRQPVLIYRLSVFPGGYLMTAALILIHCSLSCPTCQRSYAAKCRNVENIGFEPMASCMPCKRSSQLS